MMKGERSPRGRHREASAPLSASGMVQDLCKATDGTKPQTLNQGGEGIRSPCLRWLQGYLAHKNPTPPRTLQ